MGIVFGNASPAESTPYFRNRNPRPQDGNMRTESEFWVRSSLDSWIWVHNPRYRRYLDSSEARPGRRSELDECLPPGVEFARHTWT